MMGTMRSAQRISQGGGGVIVGDGVGSVDGSAGGSADGSADKDGCNEGFEDGNLVVDGA